MTITLCGLALSNYYNKVKLVLLEKAVPFEEELVAANGPKSEAVLAASPLGKIPFVRTPQGTLCESAVICDYLERIAPEPALLPADAFAAAKVRELAQFIELHLELVARELYAEAFFGGRVADADKVRARKRLERSIPAFARLARFAPYVAGETFTLADCAAFVHLPVVSMATRAMYGEDLLVAHGLDWKGYVKFIGQRPAAQRVDADRKAVQAQALASMRQDRPQGL
jgi:glutathione S-transferase